MDLRQVSDDFFTIGNIAVLQRKTGNDVYDFDFRNHFGCKSVIAEIKDPILLHIGAERADCRAFPVHGKKRL